jgi:hypothetical protein
LVLARFIFLAGSIIVTADSNNVKVFGEEGRVWFSDKVVMLEEYEKVGTGSGGGCCFV